MRTEAATAEPSSCSTGRCFWGGKGTKREPWEKPKWVCFSIQKGPITLGETKPGFRGGNEVVSCGNCEGASRQCDCSWIIWLI